MKRWTTRFVALCIGCTAALSLSAQAADFAGGGTGAIPDNTPAGINVTFSVSGFVQPVQSVRLALNITHTFVGDLRATLISPGGVAHLLIFGRVGSGYVGLASPSSNLNGSYVFEDGGQDLWAATTGLSTDDTIPPGRYRTSTTSLPSSSSAASLHGGCTTSLAGAFGSLAATDVNGTWTLNIADEAGGDIGAVTSALLSLNTTIDAIFANGFDAPVHGTCVTAWLDLTGSGRTSYVVVRNTGGGATGDVTWYVQDNPAIGTGAASDFVLGQATDFFLSGDWDGDGIGDAAVWRQGTPGQFIVRPSSHPSRLLTVPFGQSGDNPTHAGDYDGDGLTDFAMYREGASTGLASHTLIHLSGGGPDRDLVTGKYGAYPAGGVDYSGDGIADMAIQSDGGANVASFRIYNGINGAPLDTFNFGTPTDVIVTGNHSGNAVADITVVRGSMGNFLWTTRDSSTGVGQPAVTLGVSGTDLPLGGDYDGDGLDDYAIWRPSATLGQSKFIVRRSTLPSVPIDVFFGQSGDYPVGNSRTH